MVLRLVAENGNCFMKSDVYAARAYTYICTTDPLSLPQQYSVYPIIWAAGRGHAEIVHLLLQHGAKVNCSDKVTESRRIFIIVLLNYCDVAPHPSFVVLPL